MFVKIFQVSTNQKKMGITVNFSSFQLNIFLKFFAYMIT